MSIVHDNIIQSFSVDFENETLIIKTDETDVIFTGYLTHIFRCEVKNSIILDIEEFPLNNFIISESKSLNELKSSGWHILSGYETESDLLNYLQINKYRAFLISASVGLNGWVLAKQTNIDIHKWCI
ncbi:MAG: hypothetical protein FWE20_02940 [Defluviitaleaceae bacterium]|nr:hypothetical protein [Defluviitaleaceae bacterium]